MQIQLLDIYPIKPKTPTNGHVRARWQPQKNTLDRISSVANELKVSGEAVIVLAFGILLARRALVDSIQLGILASLPTLGTRELKLDLNNRSTVGDILKDVNVAISQHNIESNIINSNYQFVVMNSSNANASTELSYQLALSLTSQDDGLAYSLYFDSAVFEERQIHDFGEAIADIACRLNADIKNPISSIHGLSENEVRILIEQNNATKSDFPNRCLHELFEDQVRLNPDAIAIIDSGEAYTYDELNQQANRIAHYLISLGGGADTTIAIAMNKSFLFTAALMGISKTGAAYLPVDLNYPGDRIAMMLGDVRPIVVITNSADFERHCRGFKTVNLQRSVTGPDWNFDESNPDIAVPPEAIFYEIFTSGSTGKPKAIRLNHEGRTNNFFDFLDRFKIGNDDSILGVSSISFDMCAFDVFGTLASGATLILLGDAIDPIGWAEALVDYEVSVWHSAPALFELVLDIIEADPSRDISKLRLALLGGDWIPLDMPDRYHAMVPNGQFVSLGGASEVSMDSTIYIVENVESDWKSIPYGKPMANQLAYILDEALRPVPTNVPAQLFLGGIGVGEGYRNRDELTQERFISDPFGPSGARMYMTGDCARWHESSQIELLGRLDFQVKINGLRIELGEIEQTLLKCQGVEKATVVRAGPVTNGKLIAFITGQSLPSLEQDAQQALEMTLPSHMVPSLIIVLDKIPLSPNGKVDRSFLMKKAEALIT